MVTVKKSVWNREFLDNTVMKQCNNYSPHLMSEMEHGCRKQMHIHLIPLQSDSDNHLRRRPLLQNVN